MQCHSSKHMPPGLDCAHCTSDYSTGGGPGG
jgi:hypothetical protein